MFILARSYLNKKKDAKDSMGQPRGKRSPNGRMRQKAREFIWKYSFNDVKKSETVCLTDALEVTNMIWESKIYGETSKEKIFNNVPEVGKGLILSDSRGQGAFQT